MPSSQSWTSDGANTSTSKPFPVDLGSGVKNYTVKTETNISQGNVSASKLTLQDEVVQRSGKSARALATSTDGGKTWVLEKDSEGKSILDSTQIAALYPGNKLYTAIRSASQIDAKANKATDKQVSQLSNGNEAATPTTEQPNESSQPLTDDNLKSLQKGIAGRPYRKEYGDLYYPENIGKTTSDVIKFTMVRYGTKSLSTETLSFGSRDLTEILGSVTMSIQPTISDYNAVNWNPSEMNPLAQGAAAASLEFIDTGSVEGVTKLIQKTKDVEDENLKKAIIAAIAQEAAGAKGLLTRLTGAMFNNNLELLFQGPQLRQFDFTFKLSPRSKSEAEMVRKIIRFFKQGSAVQRSVANLFLKSPHVFNLEYIYGKDRKPHGYLNKIKTCALVSVAVDYTPTGSYMTYEEDGSMVSYNLTLTFNELEPVYEDEYD